MASTPVKQSPTIKRLLHLKEQLITEEDPIHVHKVLGILVLASFIWRLSQFGASDMRFATQPEWTIPTLILHLCLNLSSFEFRIPSIRIRSDGGRIWPEYRLHSLIFGARSIGCIAVNWYEQHFADPPLAPNYNFNFGLVLAALLAAEIASSTVNHRSNSIRELKASPAVKYYFSAMQFFATSMHLLGVRRNSIYFYMLFVVQLTPFLMTLRRKNLVAHSVNVFLYGVLLAGGIATLKYEKHNFYPQGDLNQCVVRLVGATAAFWRMGPWPASLTLLRNKYLIWATMHFVVLQRLLRPVLEKDPNALLTPTQVQIWSHCMMGTMILYGVYKHFSAQTQESAKKE